MSFSYIGDVVGAAKIGGKFVREMYLEGNVSMEYKSRREIVTSADKGSEELIREFIKERFPEHRVIGEEKGDSGGESEFVWYIDPIDGTTNFYHHIPYFAVSIALQKNDNVICGAVYNPITEEVFYAEKGKGAYLNGNEIKPSDETDPSKMFIASCHGRSDDDIKAFLSIMNMMKYRAQDMRKLGSASLELCYTACGRVNAFIGYDIKPWDFKAGVLICEESGCRVENIDTGEGQNSLIACSPNSYQFIRKVLGEAGVIK